MSGKKAGLILIITLLFCADAFFIAQRIEAATHFKAEREMRASDQARAVRKRRLRKRRRGVRRQQSPPSNTNPATEAAKSPNKGQPVLRVYDPAEDGTPPARPTPTPGMRDPEK